MINGRTQPNGGTIAEKSGLGKVNAEMRDVRSWMFEFRIDGDFNQMAARSLSGGKAAGKQDSKRDVRLMIRRNIGSDHDGARDQIM